MIKKINQHFEKIQFKRIEHQYFSSLLLQEELDQSLNNDLNSGVFLTQSYYFMALEDM